MDKMMMMIFSCALLGRYSKVLESSEFWLQGLRVLGVT